VISFDLDATLEKEPTANQLEVQQAIESLNQSNEPGTNIAGAMNIANDMISQNYQGNKLLIILTDGAPDNGL
jgi:uncharacterized protein with von Willebrand factor type A (vWA) domain